MKTDPASPSENRIIGGISITAPSYETIALLQRWIAFLVTEAVEIDSFGETALAFAVLKRPVCMEQFLAELDRCSPRDEELVRSALQAQVGKSLAELTNWSWGEFRDFNRWLVEEVIRKSGAAEEAVEAALKEFDTRLKLEIDT